MKYIIFIQLLILSFHASADACLTLMGVQGISAATELQQQISKIPIVKFDPKFCQAVTTCNKYRKEQSDKLLKEELNKTYKKLPETIEKYQKIITELKEKISIEDTQLIDHYIKLIASSQQAHAKYLNHLKDPINFPHPMKEAGDDLTPAEQKVKLMKDMETYYQSLPKQIAESKISLKTMQSELAVLEAKTPPSVNDIALKKLGISYAEKSISDSETVHKKYRDYLKDPKSNPDFLANASNSCLDCEDVMEQEASSSDPCYQVQYQYNQVANNLIYHKSGDCGFTPEELVMLSYYTESGYFCMNPYLRNKTGGNQEVELLIKTLNKGLAKLPNYQGLVRRGASLPEAIRQQHSVGSIVTYDAYTSTSTASGFPGKDIFLMYSKSGKPVMGFSGHEDENEVLFAPGAKFKVLDVTTEGETNYFVMKEVSGDKDQDTVIDNLIMETVNVQRTPAVKSTPFEGGSSAKTNDSWFCPLDDSAKVPEVVPQINVPLFTMPIK